MAYHLMKYHNFTNKRTGVLVVADPDNIGAYGSNRKRLIHRLKCAYIGRECDGTDCVFQNAQGHSRLAWHGTWHHMDGLVGSGQKALHVEFSYNSRGQAQYNKHAVLWPVFGNQRHAEALGSLGLDLKGADYKQRQVAAGLGCVIYNGGGPRHVDEDIIAAARDIMLAPFIQAVDELDESVADELARDPLALDTEYQQAAVDREYREAALALETEQAPGPPGPMMVDQVRALGAQPQRQLQEMQQLRERLRANVAMCVATVCCVSLLCVVYIATCFVRKLQFCRRPCRTYYY